MKLQKKQTDKTLYWLFAAALALVLYLLAVAGLKDFNVFLLHDDEFGYWTASAYLTGTDWFDISSGISYYSYGYGFFVITPIRLLIQSPARMYRAAIVVNALFLVASFFIARNVVKKLYPEIHPLLNDILCFLVMAYPANILWSHISWAECFLIFLFWVFVEVSLRVIRTPTFLNHVALAFVIVLLYAAHQRTLAVILATVMVQAWLFCVEKERRKDIAAFAAALGFFLFGHCQIKKDLLQSYYQSSVNGHKTLFFAGAAIVLLFAGFVLADKKYRKMLGILVGCAAVAGIVYLALTKTVVIAPEASYRDNSSRIAINDYAGQVGKFKEILTLSGFVKLLQSILGKWFYLCVSTLFMIWWAVECLGRKTAEYFAQRFRRSEKKKAKGASGKKQKPAETAPDDPDAVGKIWYIWLFLALIGNFMIAAIYMLNPIRNDILLYGRYTEYMIGIYVIIGVMEFLREENRTWIVKGVIYLGIALFSGIICQDILDELNMTSYQAYHSICTALFLEKGGYAYDRIMQFTFWGMGVGALVMCVMKFHLPGENPSAGAKNKKAAKSGKSNAVSAVNAGKALLLTCLLTCLSARIAYSMVFGTIQEKQNLRIYNIGDIINCLHRYDADGGEKVYYVADTEARYWSESFQFYLKDQPVKLITSDRIQPGESAFYITGNEFPDQQGPDSPYYCLDKTYQFALLVGKDSDLGRRIRPEQ